MNPLVFFLSVVSETDGRIAVNITSLKCIILYIIKILHSESCDNWHSKNIKLNMLV